MFIGANPGQLDLGYGRRAYAAAFKYSEGYRRPFVGQGDAFGDGEERRPGDQMAIRMASYSFGLGRGGDQCRRGEAWSALTKHIRVAG